MEVIFSNVWVFIGAQLINVILSTMKAILTVKANKTTSAIINAVTYAFYAGVVKLMVGHDLTLVIGTTFLANIIGVPIATWIVERAEKEKKWKIQITCKKKEDIARVQKELLKNQICCLRQGVVLWAFTENRKESRALKKVLAPYQVKHDVTVIEKSL